MRKLFWIFLLAGVAAFIGNGVSLDAPSKTAGSSNGKSVVEAYQVAEVHLGDPEFLEPETMEPVEQLEPETMEPAAQLEPETMEPAEQLEPEKMEPAEILGIEELKPAEQLETEEMEPAEQVDPTGPILVP